MITVYVFYWWITGIDAADVVTAHTTILVNSVREADQMINLAVKDGITVNVRRTITRIPAHQIICARYYHYEPPVT